MYARYEYSQKNEDIKLKKEEPKTLNAEQVAKRITWLKDDLLED